MRLTRRDLLRLLLAAPIAAAVDVEQLLWTPKPIITVPAMPLAFHPDAFALAMDPMTGVTIRFVQRFNVKRGMDFYGEHIDRLMRFEVR